MRLAAYTDYPYHRVEGAIYAERAFALFLARLGEHFDRLTVLGRLVPGGEERARYELGERVDFVALPYYARLSDPLSVLPGLAGTLRAFWRALGESDGLCLFGPHPLAFPLALMTWARGKKLVLGVRQDTPEYVRHRHPERKGLQFLARLIDGGFRLIGRFCSVIAVGPAVASNYRHARRLIQISVSLVDEDDIIAPESRQIDYGGELTVLSVGRLDAEKNPLLLADILALLLEREPRWRLIICGEGSLEAELAERLSGLGVASRAELRGYVPKEGGLMALYRESHAFLHVSWTEGLPQVLYEAFAAALPVVATDVGGIGAAVGEAVNLIAPGDAKAGAEALAQLGSDRALRERRVRAGGRLVRSATMQAECARLAEFIKG